MNKIKGSCTLYPLGFLIHLKIYDWQCDSIEPEDHDHKGCFFFPLIFPLFNPSNCGCRILLHGKLWYPDPSFPNVIKHGKWKSTVTSQTATLLVRKTPTWRWTALLET